MHKILFANFERDDPSFLLHNLTYFNSILEEIGMKEVTVQPISVKGNLKEVEDKLGQLVREVSKLQEQLTVISSQANGTFSSAGQSSTRM